MKKLKSTYIAIGFVLMYTPYLMGSSETIPNKKPGGVLATSGKIQAKANLSNDIERPLLRPVQGGKEETPTAHEPGVVAAPSPQPQSKPQSQLQAQPSPLSDAQGEHGEEAIRSILNAEKEKLQALERKYGALEDELKSEAGNGVVDFPNQATVTSPNNKHAPIRDLSSAKNVPSTKTAEKPLKGVGANTGNPVVGQQVENNKNLKEFSDSVMNSRLEMTMKTVNSFNVAECYYKLCEYENALKAYKLLTLDNCPVEQYHWAQFQIANCYRNLKDLDAALGEFKRFIGLSNDNELIDQANWYIGDIQWWKTWNEKKSILNNQLLAASGGKESK